MTAGTTANRMLLRIMGGCLAALILTGQPLAAHARKDKEAPWPVRDFLPPVATINGKVDPNANSAADQDLEAISLVGVTAPTLNKTPRVEKLIEEVDAGQLNPSLKTLSDLQGQVDEADLNRLWEATVERNPVIRFSLEKIATPADIQTKQSSQFLKKTLSVLISGATMAATSMPGGGAYRDMGAMAASNALQNLVSGRTQPTPNSLSATEQIQLAGLIDELKVKLIHNYQDYKNTLKALAESHAATMKHNNLYSQALASKNDLAVMAAGAAYYQSLVNETALRQKAKLYRLQLERLAGPEAVDDLQLAVFIPDEAMQNARQAQQPPQTSSLTPVPSPQQATAASAEESPLPELPPEEIGPMLPDAEVGPEAPVGPLPAASASHQKSAPKASGGLQPIADKVDEGGRHDR